MLKSVKIPCIFIISAVVITLIFSTLFVFIYLSPDQSNATSDQQQALYDKINNEIPRQYEIVKNNCSGQSKPLFNKLVFIVIDAFRSDFVEDLVGENKQRPYNFPIPFIDSLLRQRKGLSVISRAQTPTVTLPKLKTILSGSTSNFIDILFNFNAVKFGTDNVINQAMLKKKRIIFYGDDTWLQMFDKSSFVRSNVTLSFFARDFITVDTNVTENMRPELNKTDEWDILILHYLGVDHIGHSYGGFKSKLIPNKLREMDDVVKEIYQSLTKLNEPYLIFITGDHGMTDLGNHGGNTREETSTAVLLFSTDNNYEVREPFRGTPLNIEQNDVANLLSFYLGLQIPEKSKGKVDLKLINSFGDVHNEYFEQIKLCYLFKNAVQLQRMEGIKSFEFTDYFLNAIIEHSKLIQRNYRLDDHDHISSGAERNYDYYIDIIQRSLLDTKNENQNLRLLLISIASQFFLLIALLLYQINLRSFIFKEIFLSRNSFSLLAIAPIFANIFLLGSTSFMENEHFYYHYIASTLILLHAVIIFGERNLSKKNFTYYIETLFCLMISSTWTSLIKSAQGLIIPESSQKIFMFSIIAISFLGIYFYLTQHLKSTFIKIYFTFILVQIYIFKFDCEEGFKFFPSIQDHLKAKFVYFLLFIYLLACIIKSYHDRNRLYQVNFCSEKAYSSSTMFWIFLMTLLTKPQHLPLIPMQMYLEYRVDEICTNDSGKKYKNSFIFRIVIYLYFGMCSFANLGNTNSLSTLDVSAGFTGLSEYNLVIVSFQMICSIYSTIVFWLIRLIDGFKQIKLSAKQKSLIILFIFTIRLMFLVYFQIVAYILMNHLFIWSVITPKLLYEFALTELFELIAIYAILVL